MSDQYLSDAHDAEQALCSNALFQVGGELIDPDDVVRAKINSSGMPVFHLSDGTRVTHDRFQEGDVGDFLYQALPKAQRVENQSQVLKPDWNILLQTGTPPRATDRHGGTIATYAQTWETYRHALNIPADRVAAVDSGTVYLWKYSTGDLLGSWAGGTWAPGVAVADDSTVWIADEDGNSNLIILKSTDDLSSTTQAQSFAQSGMYPSNGLAYHAANNYLIGNAGGTLWRVDLGNGTFATFQDENAKGLALDEEGERAFAYSGGAPTSMLVYDITDTNAAPIQWGSAGGTPLDYAQETDQVLYQDQDGNAMFVNEAGETEDTGFNDVVKIALDTSVI